MKTKLLCLVLLCATSLIFAACASDEETSSGDGSGDGGGGASSAGDGGDLNSTDGAGTNGQGGPEAGSSAAPTKTGACLTIVQGEQYCRLYKCTGASVQGYLDQQENYCLAEPGKQPVWQDACPSEQCLGGCEMQFTSRGNVFVIDTFYYVGDNYQTTKQISSFCEALSNPTQSYTYVPAP